MKKINIANIKGFRIGNAQNEKAGSGCTVIICEDGAVGGVDVRRFMVFFDREEVHLD